MSRVSVVIVTRNRVRQLRESLESLGTEHQIVVVDNGTEGALGSLEETFPHVRWIRLPKNFGLTKALNLGLRSAEGEFVLFLHDDTRIPGNGVSELADVLEQHVELGAVAPLLVDAMGNPTPQVCTHPPKAELVPVAGNSDIDVESVTGAALMVRGFFLKAMRQIDERYGNFGSDLDLCAQVIRRANKKIRVLQSVRAVHSASPAQSALLDADAAIGTAVYLAKYQGAAAGLKYRVAAILGSIFTFRLVLAKHLLSNQKLDGTQ